MNTFNIKKTLGLNAASSISQLFGGAYSANRLHNRNIGPHDISLAWLELTSGRFGGTVDMQKNAGLVDYFLPLLDNRDDFKAKQLSMSRASQILSQDWLMWPMRTPSEVVQVNIFLALLKSTGLENGKLFNIRERARIELNMDDRFNLPEKEQKALEKKFEERVKEYQGKYSLRDKVTLKEVDGEKVIDIPGISRDSQQIADIRNIVRTMSQDALGETNEYDVIAARYRVLGRLFMTFKNWIPKQIDVRFGEFRQSQAHESWEYGRYRMFAKAMSGNFLRTVFQLIPFAGTYIGQGMGRSPLIEKAKESYKQNRQEAIRMGTYNKETFISEGEFIEKFMHGVEASFTDFRTGLVFMIIMFSGVLVADDDDDPEEKSFKALARKQIDKLADEVSFFYNPSSGIDILGGSLPVFSLVKDAFRLFNDLNSQFFGFTLEQIGWDEKGIQMQERAKPVKRLFKMVPAMKEMLTYIPIVSPETAKEWGVTITDKRSF